MASNLNHQTSTRSPFGPPAKYQQARLFRIYNHYRVVISVLLAGLLFIDPFTADIRFRWLEYYQVGVLAYLALNAFIALTLLAGFQPRRRHITLSVLVDILTMHGLLLASSGITNGLANLVIVVVAAGNILTPTRMGTAAMLQGISRRVIRSEAVASSRTTSIAELEQLNPQIIQRMRTGILVLDRHGGIPLANAAAEDLLFGVSAQAAPIEPTPPEL